ncbi:Rieske 2Fe-2S domain-containing protein [Scytonema sp. PCC 10023]|uniref:MstF n=1 Tax=Scytonema sp. PCC 10023 TaxID=1680591 RepID=A0A2D1CM85_9CYAN|nr:MstF [Scytonema sp. PCC 10023]
MSTNLEQIKDTKITQLKTKTEKGVTDLAASWYVAMESKDLGKKPKEIELFGQPLVAWRDQNGHPVIMQRYCSHMGTSLGMGKVIDGCLQCPFHHWSFDSSGQCVSIPEVENIPSKAHQTTYVTVERYDYVWVWYGSKTPLFPLPEFPAAEQERHKYMRGLRFSLNTTTTVPRLLENAYDYPHYFPVHSLKSVKEPIKCTLLNRHHPEQYNDLLIPNEAWYGALIEVRLKRFVGIIGAVVGALGLRFEKMDLLVNSWPSGHVIKTSFQGDEKLKLMVATSPINESKTLCHISIMVKKPSKFWLTLPYYMVFGVQPRLTVMEDLPFWNNMKPDGGGAYVIHDHVLLKFREFYQKWVDKIEQ